MIWTGILARCSHASRVGEGDRRDLLSHRFSNNAIVPFSGFSDIEEYLVKQWSMMFQRLLREDRERGLEGRKADAIFEQIQDLKAAVLQSINTGDAREIARSVIKYRRLADFLLELRAFDHSIEILDYEGDFELLLKQFGIVGMIPANSGSGMSSRTTLLRKDGTRLRVRVPDRRFMDFYVQWKEFCQLDRDTRAAVLDGVSVSETFGPIIMPIGTEEIDPRTIVLDLRDNASERAVPDVIAVGGWTDERLATLTELWKAGRTASEIAQTLGGVSRNAVIGKAHRLGLPPTPRPSSDE